MDLKMYINKRVRILARNGETFQGLVNDYIYPEDNENGKESIVVDGTFMGLPVEVYEDDIVSIEIL